MSPFPTFLFTFILLASNISAFLFSPPNNGYSCELGWISLGGNKCYLIETGPDKRKQWTDANDYCQAKEAKLWLPSSTSEELEIWNLYNAKLDPNFPPFWIWIDVAAGFDPSNALNYTTSGGEELRYTNWLPGQPNNPGSVGFIRPKNEKQYDPPVWIDAAGPAEMDFVCEKAPVVDNDSCFQDDVLFVENSVLTESIEDCRQLCLSVQACQVS